MPTLKQKVKATYGKSSPMKGNKKPMKKAKKGY